MSLRRPLDAKPGAAVREDPGRAARQAAQRVLVEFGDLDVAIHDTVAATPTPTLDVALARISNAANYSRLWVATAALLSLLGARGRRAALVGLCAVGATSAAANVLVKPVLRRRRPVRELPGRRHPVQMPTSRSFPSGHTASAFAFSSAVGAELPALAVPLRLAATTVAWSRVQSGVHFPGDVVAGALLGASLGSWTHRIAARRRA